ncbi:hypothetical protein JYT44_02150 [Caldithrix abyssi]|nr:hypothetical protein [Caldithrix abyssi]
MITEVYSIVELTQILIGAFLGICFIQSGFDKIIDWKGNLGFLTEHFSQTFFSNTIPMLLIGITILEVLGGLLCFIGITYGMIYHEFYFLLYGLLFCGVNLVALIFGQRFAKDYEGAAVLVNYFILTIIGIMTFHF